MNDINLDPHYGCLFAQEMNDFLCWQVQKKVCFGLNRSKSENILRSDGSCDETHRKDTEACHNNCVI